MQQAIKYIEAHHSGLSPGYPSAEIQVNYAGFSNVEEIAHILNESPRTLRHWWHTNPQRFAALVDAAIIQKRAITK